MIDIGVVKLNAAGLKTAVALEPFPNVGVLACMWACDAAKKCLTANKFRGKSTPAHMAFTSMVIKMNITINMYKVTSIKASIETTAFQVEVTDTGNHNNYSIQLDSENDNNDLDVSIH